MDQNITLTHTMPFTPSITPSPTISIIMAAYNEEQTIGKAIESIIAQTFAQWELIVIDDGSTDNTREIILQFAKFDSRIRLLPNEKNIGLPESLNKGIKLSHAKLIARADADDINLPERLQKQFEFMQVHPEIDVLGTGAYLLDKKGNRINAVSLPATHKELQKLRFHKTHFFHPSVLIRRNFFKKVGRYDKRYIRTEDKELWLRGLKHGCLYYNLQAPLIEYKTNDYKRSWQTIKERTLSLLLIAHSYDIKGGYLIAFKLFFFSVAIKLNIHKPASLKINSSC